MKILWLHRSHVNCKQIPSLLFLVIFHFLKNPSGPDGIQFLRANIKITKNGMCKITGDQILPLSIVQASEVEVIFHLPNILY